jgi:hypothetical protein
MAGPLQAAEAGGNSPQPQVKIIIVIGAITLNYEGPQEFLKDLPAILGELQKFEAVLDRPRPTVPQ